MSETAHDPRKWCWPLGKPESIPEPVEMEWVECPHKNDRRCEYRVRVHKKAVEHNLSAHLEKFCPTRGWKKPELESEAFEELKPVQEDLKRRFPDGIPSVAQEGHPEYLKLLDERRELHILKSGGYGTDDDPMANFTAVANLTGNPRWVYPLERIQEKLTRIWSLYNQGRLDEIDEELLDGASLFDCSHAMKREDGGGRTGVEDV